MIRQLEHLTRDLILGILDDDQLTIPGPILRYWINGPCTSLLIERKKVDVANILSRRIHKDLVRWEKKNYLNIPPFISSGIHILSPYI
jgi:hypothetical protein